MPPDQVQAALAAIENQLLMQAVVGVNARVAQHAAERQAELEADRAAYARAGLDGPAQTLGQTMMLAGIGPAARKADADFVELRPAEAAEATPPALPPATPPAGVSADTAAEPGSVRRTKRPAGK